MSDNTRNTTVWIFGLIASVAMVLVCGQCAMKLSDNEVQVKEACIAAGGTIMYTSGGITCAQ